MSHLYLTDNQIALPSLITVRDRSSWGAKFIVDDEVQFAQPLVSQCALITEMEILTQLNVIQKMEPS